MNHLSESELIDLAEGARGEATVPHLQECDRCRRQLEDLRAAMSAAARVDVPEPSPLFWDHFSARVHDAVAAEGGQAGRRAWWRFAYGAPVWSGAAAILLIAVFGSARLAVRTEPAAPPASSAVVLPPAPPAPASPYDAALGLMGDLTSNLDYDSASELAVTDVTAHPGVVEESVSAMSDDEREELGRLLGEEMAAARDQGPGIRD
jgi:hypothetical protein